MVHSCSRYEQAVKRLRKLSAVEMICLCEQGKKRHIIGLLSHYVHYSYKKKYTHICVHFTLLTQIQPPPLPYVPLLKS